MSTNDRDVSARDVVIVGAGVIGLTLALALLKRGRSVRLIDAGRVGGGSSHGNCGTLTPSHAAPLAAPGMIGQALRWMLQPDAPLYIKPRFDPELWRWLMRAAARCNVRDWRASAEAKAVLLNASRRLFEPCIHSEGIDCEFAEAGLLYVFRDPRALDKIAASLPALLESGIAAERWTADRLRAEEPCLRDGAVGAIHFPGDASLRPQAFVAGLAAAVRRLGGDIVEHCALESVASERNGIELSAAGGRRFHSDQAVLAVGAWSPMLAKRIGLSFPIQPGKGYSMTFAAAPDPAPRRAMVLKERSVCVTTWGSGFRLGSTMEFSGHDSELNRVRLQALRRAAAEYLRAAPTGEPVEEWYGWRPMTHDDVPIIGALPGRDRLFAATGHGMLGVSMSLGTAELLAAMMCGEAAPFDPAPYSAARFG